MPVYKTLEPITGGNRSMITVTIKKKVDKIWTDIWARGITNPLIKLFDQRKRMQIISAINSITENATRIYA